MLHLIPLLSLLMMSRLENSLTFSWSPASLVLVNGSTSLILWNVNVQCWGPDPLDNADPSLQQYMGYPVFFISGIWLYLVWWRQKLYANIFLSQNPVSSLVNRYDLYNCRKVIIRHFTLMWNQDPDPWVYVYLNVFICGTYVVPTYLADKLVNGPEYILSQGNDFPSLLHCGGRYEHWLLLVQKMYMTSQFFDTIHVLEAFQKWFAITYGSIK